MGKVLAVSNQKGGVGKTTTCINLAAALVRLDQRVLLVDCDPQGNATTGSGVDKQHLRYSINEVLLDEVEIHQALCGVQAGYDLIPANSNLTFAEINLLQLTRREFRLRQALLKMRGSYDFVLIDCPPALNMLTINAFAAADGLLIPLQCEYYALEGLTSLLQTIQQLRERLNLSLYIHGVLRTLFDSRNRLANEVSEQLLAHFHDYVYQTIIPRNVRLAEAPSHGMPIFLYDTSSSGAQAYFNLAKEILERG